jgi:hypothetical protein
MEQGTAAQGADDLSTNAEVWYKRGHTEPFRAFLRMCVSDNVRSMFGLSHTQVVDSSGIAQAAVAARTLTVLYASAIP